MKMVSLDYSVFMIIFMVLIISPTNESSKDLNIRTDNNSQTKLPSRAIILLLQSIQNQPVLNGFRAESSKYPVIIDGNGLTVVPDKVAITLRLFGNNLIAGQTTNRKLRISFTTNPGKRGDSCSPDTDEFKVDQIIDNTMALVDIKLSETIRDDPYYLCYGFSQSAGYERLLSNSDSQLSEYFLPNNTKYLYLSDHNSMKLRVIGRELADKYRNKNENKDANIKSKLVQIMDEVNKIHRLTDEMQKW